MARIALQEPASATGSNKNIFDALQKGLGMIPNMARGMAVAPALLQGYAQLNGALSTSKISGAIREQIALLTAEANGCDYCLSAHTALGKMAGVSAHDLDAARHGNASDAKAAAALRFAGAVIQTRGGVSESDFSKARAAGLSDQEMAEIVGVVALNFLTNLFNRAFAIDIDFPLVRSAQGEPVR